MTKPIRHPVWFRRDLRADDHAALHHALRRAAGEQAGVCCVFVFDSAILDPLPAAGRRADRRVAFIHESLRELDAALRQLGGGLMVLRGAARRTAWCPTWRSASGWPRCMPIATTSLPR